MAMNTVQRSRIITPPHRTGARGEGHRARSAPRMVSSRDRASRSRSASSPPAPRLRALPPSPGNTAEGPEGWKVPEEARLSSLQFPTLRES